MSRHRKAFWILCLIAGSGLAETGQLAADPDRSAADPGVESMSIGATGPSPPDARPAELDSLTLVENGWDFESPEKIPGFGRMRAGDNVTEMVTQVLGEPRKRADITALIGPAPAQASTGSSTSEPHSGAWHWVARLFGSR